jgi:hypothetical protein
VKTCVKSQSLAKRYSAAMEEYQLSRILSFCQSTAKKRQNQHVVKPPWNPNWLPAAGIEHPNVFLVLPPETLENFPVITKPGGLEACDCLNRKANQRVYMLHVCSIHLATSGQTCPTTMSVEKEKLPCLNQAPHVSSSAQSSHAGMPPCTNL